MNNIQTNALRIAELMGYKKAVKGSYYTNGDGVYYFPDSITIKFSSYQGLMPIVFEANQSDYISFTMTSASFHVTEINTTKPMKDRLNNYAFDTEESFIEALQLAVIKYLELKNEN